MPSTQPGSSKRPLHTRLAKAHKHLPLSDIYDDDLDKHATQDKKIMGVLETEKFYLEPRSLWLGTLPIVITVIGIAQEEDPRVPLLPDGLEILEVLKNEELQKVVERCYLSKSFKDLRNHRRSSHTVKINESTNSGI